MTIFATLTSSETLIALFQGVGVSMSLALLALIFGFMISIGLVYLLNTKRTLFVWPVRGFITFMRGVPLIVQIFLIYYGSAQFEWIKECFLWTFLQHPFFCATLALALNSSAYTAILLESNIEAISMGELEAASVLNLSFYNKMRRIVLPQALSNFWSVYSNEVIMTLKSTSLVSTITLMDLLGVTRQMIAATYQSFEIFMIAGILYLLMAWILTAFFSVFFTRRAEKKSLDNALTPQWTL
jgi:arginine transport system permease protein